MKNKRQPWIDFLMLNCSGVIAYLTRIYLITFRVPFSGWSYIPHLIVLAALSILFFFHNNLYGMVSFESWPKLFFRILKSHVQVVATYVVLLYFFSPNRLSRATILLYFIYGFLLTFFYRVALRGIPHPRDWQRILLIGNSPVHQRYIEGVKAIPEVGVSIVGWIDGGNIPETLGIPVNNSGVEDVLRQHREYDAVLIGYAHEEIEREHEWLMQLNNHYITTMVMPNPVSHYIGYQVSDFFGIPIQLVNVPKTTQVDEIIKRIIDIAGSFLGLVLFAPLFLLIALLIKITSPGPVFFRQERITKGGKKFVMFKFRSMRTGAHKKQRGWTTKEDARRTFIGAFLRKTSLDETPQFWNVLIGNMSLVGPRPEQPGHVERLKEEIPNYMLRHRMKTGMSGWAQVNGWRGDTDLAKRVEFDLYYIKNWSLGMDIQVLFLTFIRGFINKNAY